MQTANPLSLLGITGDNQCNCHGNYLWVESAMIVFLPWETVATTTKSSTATAWPADNHYGTKPSMLHAHHTDTAPPASGHLLAGRGSSFTFDRTSFTPGPAPPTIHPPPSPTHVNRLSKTDPLVLSMVLRCGCKDAKTPSPRMLHSTSSTDEQRYLPKTTATSGYGLQHETSASHSGPSHPEPASPFYWRLQPRSSQGVRLFQVPAVGPRTTGSYSLPRY